MRTTEGVWMSVAPTEKCLLVALDFEGEVCGYGLDNADRFVTRCAQY